MKHNHFVFIAIAILISICYGNSLKGNFVFDDTEAIVRNGDLDWNKNSLFDWNLFRHDFWGNNVTDNTSHKSYRPMTIILYRLIRALSNRIQASNDLNPVYFHCANLTFYYLSCCLLYQALLALFISPILELSKRMSNRISILATMLFVVHPIHCEPVVSCVGLADIMSGLFCIISLIYYMEKTSLILNQDSKLFTKCLSLSKIIVTTGIAMLFKEQGITFLGIYILLDIVLLVRCWHKDRTVVKSALIISIGFYLISALLLIYIRLSIMNFNPPVFNRMDNPSVHIESVLFRCINYGYIYLLNVVIMICPIWLCFDWSMGCIPLIESFTDYRFALLVSFYLVFALIVLRVMAINRNISKTLLILSLFLIIPFTPSSNILFPVGFVIAERNLFMPVLGYLLIFAYLHQICCELFSKSIKLILNGGFCFLLITYSIRSHYRTIDWNNERDLFQKDLNVCPGNAKIYYNIGKIAADSGDSQEALIYYEKSLSLYKNYTSAMNNAANILKDQGQTIRAKLLLERATTLDCKFAPAWMNLGIVQMSLKHYTESEVSFSRAIELRPNHARTHFNLGNLYLERKQYADAEMVYKKAVKLDSKLIVAWNNLILLKQNNRQLESAYQIANDAIALNPSQHSLHFLIANIMGQQNQYKEAELHFKKAIELNPTVASYYNNLAVLYHRNQIYSLAQHYYGKTIQLDPNHKGALKQLQHLHMKIHSDKS